MARVCVVLGSVREGRLGLRVARLLEARLTSLGAAPTILDPLEVNPPLLQQPLHFMKVSHHHIIYFILYLTQDQSAAPQWMLDTHKIIQVGSTPHYHYSHYHHSSLSLS